MNEPHSPESPEIPSRSTSLTPDPTVAGAKDTTAEASNHLKTDHLLKDLGHRTVSAGFVTAGAQFVNFFIFLGGTFALSRLLTPQDFGLVAMTGSLMSILRVFREGGLSTATIQTEGITEAQVSNLFWINLAFGTLITLIGVALSPVVAWFYRDSRLTLITMLLSLSFAFGAIAVQHLALLNRQMRFKAIAAIDITSALVGLVAGTLCAWYGLGYWSLVGMQLSMAASEMVLTWSASGWRPQLPKRRSGTKPLLQFGASMTAYILLRRVTAGADTIFLGRFYSADVVGLYSRAGALLFRPLLQVISPFDRVFVPTLSRLQSQPARYRQIFIQVHSTIIMLGFALTGLFLGLCQPLVLVVLGAKWVETIPIFAWFSIGALAIPLSYPAIWLPTTQGRNRDLLTMGTIVPIITVISVVAGIPFGATGMAMITSLTGLLICVPIQFHYTGRSGPVSRRDLWYLFFRHLPLWAAVVVATGLVRQALISFSPLAQLVAGGIAGGLAAVVVIACIPSLRQDALYLIDRLKKFVQRPPATAP